MRTIKEYADILRFAIKMQIEYVEADMEKSMILEEDYYNGIITGLRMALEKIDKSEFLMD